MSRELKIFISSTFEDLAEVRKKTKRFLEEVLRPSVVSMEVFGSDEQKPKEYSLAKLRECNLFVGIYAQRYGTVDPETGLSLTELEYHEAYGMLESGKLINLLTYMIGADASWLAKNEESDPVNLAKRNTLRDLLKKRHTVDFFSSGDDVPLMVLRDVVRKTGMGATGILQASDDTPAIPRRELGVPIGMEHYTEATSSFFWGRTKEAEAVTSQVVRSRVSLLIGASGVGKTSLIRAGLQPRVRALGWRVALLRPFAMPRNQLVRSLWSQLMTGTLPVSFDYADVCRAVGEAHADRNVLVVIDQLEDMAFADLAVKEWFIAELASLFVTGPGNVRTLLSYRGDVDANLGWLWQRVTGSPEGLARLYLEPLSLEACAEAVSRTLAELGVSVAPFQAARGSTRFEDRVARDLLEESQAAGYSAVYPPFIQMLVARIYEDSRSDARYGFESYAATGGARAAIAEFLMRQLRYLGRYAESGRTILSLLASAHGTKLVRSLEDIQKETSIPQVKLGHVMNRLVDLRLARATTGGYEIAHDYLAKLVVDQLTPDEAEARKYKAILSATAVTYEEAQSMLSMPEHLRIYRLRAQIRCSQDEVKLLFSSYMFGNGPVHFWLQHEQPSTVQSWASAHVRSPNDDVARSAIRFLFRSGGKVDLARACKLLSSYVHGEELALIVQQCATKEDIRLIMKVAARTKSPHLEDACVRTAARLLGVVDEPELKEIVASRRSIAEDVTDEFSLTIGATRPARELRSIAFAAGDWRRVIAIQALGVRGRQSDIESLDRIAETKRLSSRLRSSASNAADALRWKFHRHQVVRDAVRETDPRRALLLISRAEVPVRGLNAQFVLRLADHEELLDDLRDEAFETARSVATRRDLPALRARLRSAARIDPHMRHLVFAICDLGGSSDFDFLLSVFRTPAKPMKMWYIKEVADAMARLADRSHMAQLELMVSRREFWAYSSAPPDNPSESIMDYKRGPSATKWDDSYKDRVYYVKRIVIAAFCRLAGRRQVGMLTEMLDHDYWVARMTASDALARLGKADDLPALLDHTLSPARKHTDAAIQLLCKLDEKLTHHRNSAKPERKREGY